MKQIRLKTTNPFDPPKYITVDDEDFALINRFNWWGKQSGKKAYAWTSDISGKKTYVHQMLIENPGDELTIDHINRDPLDNRRCNLRLATPSQQSSNIKKFRGSSLYKGVNWDKKSQKWAVHIKSGQTKVYGGMFLTQEAAAIAYNVLATKLHGEFAVLNEIKDVN